VQLGTLYSDEHGTELPDQHGARNVALEIVSQLARDAVDDLWRGGACVSAWKFDPLTGVIGM
jgi:hypothetical protein